MNDHDDIDDLFRELAGSHEMKPSGKVWERLDARLERKENTRNKAIIFRLKLAVSLLLVLMATGVGYYFLNDPGSNESKNRSEQQAIAQKRNFTAVTRHSEANPSNTLKPHLHLASERSEKNEHPFIKTEASISDPLNSVKAGKKNSTAKQKTSEKEFARDQESAAVDEKRVEDETIIKNFQSATRAETEKEAGEPLLVGSSTAQPVTEEENAPVQNEPAQKTDSAKELKTFSLVADPLPELTKNELDSLRKKHLRERLSIAAYFSPDFTMNYLQDNDQTDNENEADYNADEVSSFSYNTGLLMGYDLTKHWSIRFGASYAYLAQTIRPKVAYARVGADGETHYQFNTSYGSTPLVNDQNYTPLVGDSLKILSNSFQSLSIFSIPLICKYQVTRKRFDFYAQAGLNLNFIARSRLVIVVPGQPQSVQKVEGLNNFYLGGILSAGVAYHPMDKLSIMLEPTFRGAITSINNNTPMITWPLSLGLALGVGWHF